MSSVSTLFCSVFLFWMGTAQADPRIDHFFEKYSHWEGPGAAIAVIKSGKVIHARGYGLAIVESQARIDTATLFNLASDSKQFTAMAIAILHERGLLNYRDLASKYLELPDYAHDVTIFHLIHHLSGLPEYLDEEAPGPYPDWYPDELKSVLCHLRTPATNAQVLELLRKKDKKLEFPAGSQYKYSNTGYVLLASVVESISGLPFAKFVEQNIFKPLGMTHTFVNEKTIPSARGIALSYGGMEGNFHGFGTNSCEKIYGDGSIYSNIDDLILWAKALHQRRSHLLSPAAMEELFAPVTDSEGRKVSYGFGWRTEADKLPDFPAFQEPMIWHDGEWLGFENSLNYFPKRDLWVIALTNHHELTDEIDRIVRRIIELPGLASPPSDP